MRFVSQQDYNTILRFNKELLNSIIDVNIILFKINAQETKTNIYGEAINNKVRYRGVKIAALIDRQQLIATSDIPLINVEQTVSFAFLRQTLIEKNVYPEIGDFVQMHNNYYEIHNITESQLVAGQELYNHTLLCYSHLSRNTTIDIEQIL